MNCFPTQPQLCMITHGLGVWRSRFAAGLTLADGFQCQPAELEVIERSAETGAATKVRLTCVEGQYHQVKRMLGVCGGAVSTLHRESIGPLRLDDEMREGDARELTTKELHAIKALLPPSTRDGKQRAVGKEGNGGRGNGGN